MLLYGSVFFASYLLLVVMDLHVAVLPIAIQVDFVVFVRVSRSAVCIQMYERSLFSSRYIRIIHREL